jgi:beta-xylosidase
MLTQRMMYPGCLGEVTVDVSKLQDGDYAGLCALQGYYGFVGVTKKNGQKYLVMLNRETPYGEKMGYVRDTEPGNECEAVPFDGDSVRLKIEVDFTDMKDEAKFYYFDEGANQYHQIGKTHRLSFKLDHFAGCRFGLTVYSTKEAGGSAAFTNFTFKEIWND